MLSNKTNVSSVIDLNQSICDSSPGLCSPVLTCPGTPVHLTYISIICVVGVLSNILLLYADYKEWKKSKTPDKLLIFNLAISNIAALLLSLPFHAVILANYQDFLTCVWHLWQYRSAWFFSMMMCNFVTLATLAVIAIDRYEALTKFSHQRSLTVKTSFLVIGLVWLCSIAVVVFMATWSNECTNVLSSQPKDRTNDKYYASRIAIISITCIWIIVCITASCTFLLLAARRIRKHRQKINDMFGAVQAATEISFTKSVIALALCYVLLWIPYGISMAILSSDQKNLKLSCPRLWTLSTCYLSFSVLPGIYFIMDSRLRRYVVPQAPVAMTTLGNRAPNNIDT